MLFAPLSADNKAPYSSFPRTTTNFDDYDIKIKHFFNLKYGHSKTERRHGETIATDGYYFPAPSSSSGHSALFYRGTTRYPPLDLEDYFLHKFRCTGGFTPMKCSRSAALGPWGGIRSGAEGEGRLRRSGRGRGPPPRQRSPGISLVAKAPGTGSAADHGNATEDPRRSP